jgi:hypothetical protein
MFFVSIAKTGDKNGTRKAFAGWLLRSPFLLFFLLLGGSLFAQDARMSQLTEAPVMMNAALSGRFVGEARVGTLLGWHSTNKSTVGHQAIYFDVKRFFKQSDRSAPGLGRTGADTSRSVVKGKDFSDDKTFVDLPKSEDYKHYLSFSFNYYQYGKDFPGFTNTRVPLTGQFFTVGAAYHRYLTANRKHYMGVGTQIGGAYGELDETNGKAQGFDREIIGGAFRYVTRNAGSRQGEVSYFDWNLGAYYGFQTDKYAVEMGVGANHLTRPKNDFFDDDESRLRRRACAYINNVFLTDSKFAVLLRGSYWQEGFYWRSSSFNDSVYIQAFYAGVELMNMTPLKDFRVHPGLTFRDFRTIMPSVHFFLGTGFDTKLSMEWPFNKARWPAYTAVRTELSLNYNFGKKTKTMDAKNLRSMMWW